MFTKKSYILTWLFMVPKVMLNVLISVSKESTLEFKSKKIELYRHIHEYRQIHFLL